MDTSEERDLAAVLIADGKIEEAVRTLPALLKPVVFETGYGPSGLPHIGTFGEVARTTMIRRAFEVISDIPTRLICFSDDVDGMRKVPENVPQQDMLRQHMQKPLTSVPDPYGQFDSFGAHNNAMLRRFLDTFGFEYEYSLLKLSSASCPVEPKFQPDQFHDWLVQHFVPLQL